ncbi:MAG: hypothetical protein FWG52_06490 [Proteobacteria bacterium]|jgi:hypothetical protein|nr:hypothetical protein [Pseudomonadota bacterium]
MVSHDIAGSRFKFWPVLAVNGQASIFVACPDMRKIICLVLAAVLPLLSACDRLADMLEIPDPAKVTADAEAIGSACRQTGRSLEDCYALNPDSQKAAIFGGWKSMNEYMIKHSLKEVPSLIPRAEAPAPPHEPAPPAATNAPQPATS